MHSYKLQTKPFIVPTTDGKTIEEHFGLPSTGTKAFSLAHMTAPAGWNEPYQVPEFDEITFVIKGKKEIIIDGEKIIVHPNQSILVHRGTRVKYSNPFDEPIEYISICIPAFTIEKANREEQ
ncbi:MAG: cupin domain-containing protein [Ignavibacteriae bacterium]|nr:MAG: cupin domain-containing protein [Ignavibacteriota bacterium]